MTSRIISNAAAIEIDNASVAGAVERLREAMLAGDGATLRMLIENDLSYGHSSGPIQDRDDFVTSLDGTNSFKSLVLSKQTVKVVDDTAIVRHVFDSENNLPNGETGASHIGVLQIWKRRPDGWRLFARQAHLLAED